MVVTGAGDPADPYEITFTIPAGRTGINPRGDYSSVTAYDPRDMVTDNGSSWVALQATTGNAPPVLPATANAYWQLAARRGVDGTGTGDVVGPNGVTANNIAAFSGTTGKVLKALTSAEVKTWLATTALEVVFNNGATNMPGAPATAQAAIESLWNFGSKNDALLALEIADLKGVRLGMRNGIADAFDDATGVDAAASTNEVYDATNDWYVGVVETSEETGATTGPVAVGWAGYTAADQSYAVDNSKTVAAIWIFSPNAGTGKVKLFLELTSSSFDIIAEAAMTHPGGGWFRVNLASPVVIPATGTYRAGGYWASGGPTGSGWPSSATYPRAYKSGDVVGSAQTAFITTAGAAFVTRVTYVAVGNMALRSVAYGAGAVPTTGRLAVQLVETDSITINTDVIAKMSRDGGVTWATAVLTLAQFQFLPRVYEANNISLSGLGSGSSMKWEIDTANNKNVAVSGVVMQWS